MSWLNDISPLMNHIDCGGAGCGTFCIDKVCFFYQGTCYPNTCFFHFS